MSRKIGAIGGIGSAGSVGSVRNKRTPLRFASILIALALFAAAVAGGCTNGNGGKDPVADPTVVPQEGTTVIPSDEQWAAVAGALTPKPKSITLKGGSVAVGEETDVTQLPYLNVYETLLEKAEISIDGAMGPEAYKVEVDEGGVKIAAGSDDGVYYALKTLTQLSRVGRLPKTSIEDEPTVPLRGVIEGFYGQAWTHQFRLNLFTFMGKYKLNTYIYAPKDDAKHRSRWRATYSGEELKKMQELADTAKANHVKFVYALSPGLDIKLGSGYEKDLDSLFKKCEQLYELGVRYFAILLDDIESRDAEGHAKLLNDFQTGFIETHEGCGDLIAISPEFCTGMLTSYTNKFAPLLNDKIIMMWTGSGVIPAKILSGDMRSISKKYGSNVLVWWNYPVNDTMADNLFLGPCENVSPKIQSDISGFVSNPMNQGYASMLPLITISDFLWDPDGYDSEAALVNAAAALMPKCAAALLTFADLCRASIINGSKSTFSLAEAVDRYNKGEADLKALEELIAAMDKLREDLEKLKNDGDPTFVDDARRWIDKALSYAAQAKVLFEVEAEALRVGVDNISEEASLKFYADFKTARDLAKGNSAIVSPDVLAPLSANALGRLNRLLKYKGEAERADAVAISDCAAYEDYVLDNINDGDESTYFWTQGTLAVASGNRVGYIGLDLGFVTDIENVYITTGFGGKDALTNMIVEYSEDGNNWTTLASGKLGEEVILKPEGVRARYVRLRNGDPSSPYWVIIRSFEVNSIKAKN